MIPPLIRRCPNCGHVNISRRFTSHTTDDGVRIIECPECSYEYEPIDNPLLN